MPLRLKTRFSLKAKIVFVIIGVLSLYFSLSAFINSSIFTEEYFNTLESESVVIGHSLELQLDRLLRLGIPLEEITGFEEQCQEIVNNYEDISYAMVVDLNGKILFHNDPLQHGITINDPEVLNAMKNYEETVQIFSMDEEYYDTTIPIFDTHGQHIGAVRIGFPVEIINQKTGVIIFSSVIVALVSFIIATIVLIFALSTWVTKPINKLIVVIKDIREKGDLNKKVEVITRDELGQLASSFNQMTADLKESRDKLVEARENLEKQVVERTKELQQTLDELKESQKKIELQNVQLKRLDRLKSAFLNTTSHELRTPMASIKGYIQLLLKQSLGEISEEQKNALNVVLRNTGRLDHLIQDILDISRLESGTMKFVSEKTDVRMLMEETVETMQSLADRKGIKINLEIEDKIPELVVDQERIRQVLMNLIDNAIKFSPNDSGVMARARKEKDDVLFEVKDSGRGIPKEHQDKIFGTFYQVDSGMDRKFGGVGLGLAISRGIVVSHGGKIWMESNMDNGSTFRFTLPVKPVEDMEGRFKEVDMFGLKNKELYYFAEIISHR